MRSHLTRVSIVAALPAKVVIASATVAAEVVAVLPHMITALESTLGPSTASTISIHETITLPASIH